MSVCQAYIYSIYCIYDLSCRDIWTKFHFWELISHLKEYMIIQTPGFRTEVRIQMI